MKVRKGPTHGELPVTVRKVEGEDNALEFIASTDGAVRDGSILKQSWELGNFRRNPLFLWGHDYSGLPVGKVRSVKVQKASEGKGKELRAVVQFVPGELYPFADQVRQFYEQGYLHAVSVGFRPLQARDLTDKEREENGVTNPWAQVFERSELYEISAVTVPMDANALKASVQRGFVQDEDVAEKVAQAEVQAHGADSAAIAAALDAIEFEEEFGAGVEEPAAETVFEQRLARATTRLEQAAGTLARAAERAAGLLEMIEEQLTGSGGEEEAAEESEVELTDLPEPTDDDEDTPEETGDAGAEGEDTEGDGDDDSGAIEDALGDVEKVLADLTTVGKE